MLEVAAMASPLHPCYFTADEWHSQLSQTYTHVAGSPTTMPPGPAPLCSLCEVQESLSHLLQLVKEGAIPPECLIQ